MAKPFLRRVTKTTFLLLNFISAVFFITGANILYFPPAKWWFIGLFSLGLPYLVLLLVVFFVGWLVVKSPWAILSLVSLAAGWPAITNIIPPNTKKNFSLVKSASALRVMSWNVEQFDILEYKHHPEVKTEMLALINKYKPDVACFQEMVGGDYNRTINYLGDFKRVLGFENYYYTYNLHLDFDGRHHFGIIIFSRYPFINKQTVTSNFDEYNSTFQYTDIVFNTDTIRIFNIHLQSLRFSVGNLQYLNNPHINTDTTLTESRSILGKLKSAFKKRGRQAERVKLELNQSPYPAVLCGDFNDVPNSYAYRIIGKGFKNAFVEKGFGIGRTFSGISPTLRIDNIFVDPRLPILQFTRVNKKLSDHFPVIADISVSNNGK